mgnify:CR=1 FL=1
MNNKSNKLALLSLVLMVMFILTACSSGDGGGGGTTTPHYQVSGAVETADGLSPSAVSISIDEDADGSQDETTDVQSDGSWQGESVKEGTVKITAAPKEDGYIGASKILNVNEKLTDVNFEIKSASTLTDNISTAVKNEDALALKGELDNLAGISVQQVEALTIDLPEGYTALNPNQRLKFAQLLLDKLAEGISIEDLNNKIKEVAENNAPLEDISEGDLLVSTKEELNNAVEKGIDISDIKLADNITADIIAERLVNIDFAEYTLTGSLSYDTVESGTIVLDGTASPSIDGELSINAQNAEVENNIEVITTDVQNVSANSFYNTSTIDTLNINDPDGCSINNQAGSSVNNLNVEEEASNVNVENDGAAIKKTMNIRGQDTKVNNKNGTTISGTVNVAGRNTEITNDNTTVEAETTIEETAEDTTVVNTGSSIIKGRMSVKGKGAKIENENSEVEAEIEVDAEDVEVRNSNGARVKRIRVGKNGKGANIENSSEIDEVDVEDEAKDSTTVINEGQGAKIGQINTDELNIDGKMMVLTRVGETVSLPAIENENFTIAWKNAYLLEDEDEDEDERKEISNWTAPADGTVSRSEPGAVLYEGVVVKDGTETDKRIRMRMVVREAGPGEDEDEEEESEDEEDEVDEKPDEGEDKPGEKPEEDDEIPGEQPDEELSSEQKKAINNRIDSLRKALIEQNSNTVIEIIHDQGLNMDGEQFSKEEYRKELEAEWQEYVMNKVEIRDKEMELEENIVKVDLETYEAGTDDGVSFDYKIDYKLNFAEDNGQWYLTEVVIDNLSSDDDPDSDIKSVINEQLDNFETAMINEDADLLKKVVHPDGVLNEGSDLSRKEFIEQQQEYWADEKWTEFKWTNRSFEFPSATQAVVTADFTGRGTEPDGELNMDTTIKLTLEEINGTWYISKIEFPGSNNDDSTGNYDTINEVKANIEEGFHWDYYLYIPDEIATAEELNYNGNMLVIPNNTGSSSDNYEEHKQAAYDVLDRHPLSEIGKEMGIPMLVPTFPRPHTLEGTAEGYKYYTHALDRKTLNAHNKGVEEKYHRIDKQLVAMIEHAQNKLSSQMGIDVNDKVFMTGFSAAGSFTNRFITLHPDKVQAIAAGGINALPILPMETKDGLDLTYPVGIEDLNDLVGIDFDMEAYKKIPQYLYMGSEDVNDTLPYGDAFDDREREKIKEVFNTEFVDGETDIMMNRWNKAENFYNEKNIPAQFSTYEGLNHTINDKIIDDIIKFFENNDDNELDEITNDGITDDPEDSDDSYISVDYPSNWEKGFTDEMDLDDNGQIDRVGGNFGSTDEDFLPNFQYEVVLTEEGASDFGIPSFSSEDEFYSYISDIADENSNLSPKEKITFNGYPAYKLISNRENEDGYEIKEYIILVLKDTFVHGVYYTDRREDYNQDEADQILNTVNFNF